MPPPASPTAYPNDIEDRIASVVAGTDPSIGLRIDLLRDGIDAFLRSPIVGSYFSSPTGGLWSYPHNIVVETAMAMGVIGLIALVALGVHLVVAVARCWETHALIVALMIETGVVAMASGVIWSSSDLFVVAAMLLASLSPKNLPREPAQPAVNATRNDHRDAVG
jgi:O-antigen ligase